MKNGRLVDGKWGENGSETSISRRRRAAVKAPARGKCRTQEQQCGRHCCCHRSSTWPFEWGADWRWPGQKTTDQKKLAMPSSDFQLQVRVKERERGWWWFCWWWCSGWWLGYLLLGRVALFGNSNFRFLMILFKFAYSSVCWRHSKCRLTVSPASPCHTILTVVCCLCFLAKIV